jgi:hypothetical protein
MRKFESCRPSQPVRSPPLHMLRVLKTARYRGISRIRLSLRVPNWATDVPFSPLVSQATFWCLVFPSPSISPRHSIIRNEEVRGSTPLGSTSGKHRQNGHLLRFRGSRAGRVFSKLVLQLVLFSLRFSAAGRPNLGVRASKACPKRVWPSPRNQGLRFYPAVAVYNGGRMYEWGRLAGSPPRDATHLVSAGELVAVY